VVPSRAINEPERRLTEVERQESRSLAALRRAGSTQWLHAHQLDTVRKGGFLLSQELLYTSGATQDFPTFNPLDDHSFQHGSRDGNRVAICRLDGLLLFSYTYGLAVSIDYRAKDGDGTIQMVDWISLARSFTSCTP